MKKFLFIYVMVFVIGCTASDQQAIKKTSSEERDYEVIMYSGGAVVFHDKFHGIVNNSENSDGCYYFKGDSLIEVSGDYIIKSEN
jgi:hypothetical protein